MNESTVLLLEQLEMVQRIMQSQRLTRYANVAQRVRDHIVEQSQTIAHLTELVEVLQSSPEDENEIRFTITDRIETEFDDDSFDVDLEDTGDFDREED